MKYGTRAYHLQAAAYYESKAELMARLANDATTDKDAAHYAEEMWNAEYWREYHIKQAATKEA